MDLLTAGAIGMFFFAAVGAYADLVRLGRGMYPARRGLLDRLPYFSRRGRSAMTSLKNAVLCDGTQKDRVALERAQKCREILAALHQKETWENRKAFVQEVLGALERGFDFACIVFAERAEGGRFALTSSSGTLTFAIEARCLVELELAAAGRAGQIQRVVAPFVVREQVVSHLIVQPCVENFSGTYLLFAMDTSRADLEPSFYLLSSLAARLASNELRWFGALARMHERSVSERLAAQSWSETTMQLAHDIRSPINSLRSTLSLLRASSTEETKAIFDVCESTCRHLANIAEHLVRSVRGGDVEHGALDICDVASSTEVVVGRFRTAFPERIFQSKIDPASVVIPANHFERIMENLISNAHKYSVNGPVTLSGYVENTQYVVEVSDSGRGMSHEHLRKIGERYQRFALDTPGLGLGMSCVKALVDSSGGTIGFSSEEGIGTTVQVRLPLARPDSRAKRTAIPDDMLILDDDEACGESLARVLRTRGVAAFACVDPRIVMERVRENPDITLLSDLDIGAGPPGEFVLQLKKSQPALRVGILSGQLHDDVVYSLAAAGVQDFFEKPVDVDRVVRWAGGGGAA